MAAVPSRSPLDDRERRQRLAKLPDEQWFYRVAKLYVGLL
jgi:hypothetical protein